jgi:hypothetical protein
MNAHRITADIGGVRCRRFHCIIFFLAFNVSQKETLSLKDDGADINEQPAGRKQGRFSRM